ncbi:MAG: TonB-dependent receptor [Pyrinomonadaceae bacterium]
MKIFQSAIFFFTLFFQSLSVLAQANVVEIQGEITDQNAAVIVGASINLIQDGQTIQTATSDERGKFVFKNLAAGAYILRVEAKSFAVHEETVAVENAQKSYRPTVTLFPEIKETVTVDDSSASILDSERAAGTLRLTQKEIEALPDDPDALNEQLQQLAATSGSAPGGAVVTVDGFLAGGRVPPKSAIQSVRVNPNIYSAEYDTPPFRGGRVEIITKPGASKLSGSAFFNFNDDALNARESFAARRAETSTRQYGFQLGAPIIKKRSGFFLDFEKRDTGDAAIINAITLDGNFVANLPTPKRLALGSARADWQLGANRTQVFRFDFNSNKLAGQGAGGFNLPERGFEVRQNERNFRFTDSVALNAKTANEMRVGLTFQKFAQQAVSNERAVSVAGAFTAGGANTQFLERDEKRLEIVDNLIVSAGKHNLKAGAQITFRRVSDSRIDNPNGAFYFGGATVGGENISALEQYRRALLSQIAPTRFSVTLGTSSVAVNQWRVAFFAQDEWRLRKNIGLSLGLRYEAQTAPADFAGFAPRIGIAYSPDKKQNWIIRARAGIFYERIGEQLTIETLRLDGQRQREILIDNPSFPNPFIGGTIINSTNTIRIFDENLRPPTSLQMRVEVERQLPRGWRVSSSFSQTVGWFDLRSRNINAPLVSDMNPDPRTAPRPFGGNTNILQFESSGKTRGQVFFVGVFQPTNKYFTLFSGYLNFNFKTNADTPFFLPQSSYDESGEWARPFWQSRHRVFVTSIFNLPLKARAAVNINVASGRPFNITTGRDNNGDGNFNDRPSLTDSINSQVFSTRFGLLAPNVINGSLSRNTGTNPANITVDLNLSRAFVIGKQTGEGGRSLAVNVRFNNLLNRTNPLDVNGVLTSPFFGRANTAAPSRRIEFGLRFNF